LRRAGLAALAILSLCGCGGATAGDYAGMSEYEARTEVLQGMTQELEDRGSPIFRHRVRLVRVDRGESRGGGEAWVGTFADRTAHDRICIRVIGHPHAFGLDVDVELDHCAAGAPGV
jgi:hypothetical protein